MPCAKAWSPAGRLFCRESLRIAGPHSFVLLLRQARDCGRSRHAFPLLLCRRRAHHKLCPPRAGGCLPPRNGSPAPRPALSRLSASVFSYRFRRVPAAPELPVPALAFQRVRWPIPVIAERVVLYCYGNFPSPRPQLPQVSLLLLFGLAKCLPAAIRSKYDLPFAIPPSRDSL